MKTIFLSILSVTFLFACSSDFNKQKKTKIKPILSGEKINGDFDGDGEIEEIKIHLVKKGYNQEAFQTDEDYEFDQNEILISTNKINVKGLKFEANPKLINEGDLNENGGDELSIVSYSPNGTQVSLTLYTFNRNRWIEILNLDRPGEGSDLTLQDFQNMVYRKNNKIYYINKDFVEGITEIKQLKFD